MTMPRDTKTAEVALRLAHEFLEEIDPKKMLDAPTENLNTIALASKQIAIAEKADPDATITFERTPGVPSGHNVNSLKAQALFYEGLCYSESDPKRSLRILQQVVALDPTKALAHHWLGLVNMTQLNKYEAIQALEKAVQLEPDNMESRKALERARNLSGAQVAFHKTASATRTTASVVQTFLLILIFAGIVVIIICLYNGIYAGAAVFAILTVIVGAINAAITKARSFLS